MNLQSIPSMQDVLDRLGGIAPGRILAVPPPGTATEDDLIRINARRDRLCELVDGVLVEKSPSYVGSLVGGFFLNRLVDFSRGFRFGGVTAGNALFRLAPNLVRIPGGAFTSRDRWPGRRIPDVEIADFAPNLIVEVPNEGNPAAEVAIRRAEFLAAGVEIVWQVDRRAEVVEVFRRGEASPTRLGRCDVLDGGDVLPGLRIPLNEVFDRSQFRRPKQA